LSVADVIFARCHILETFEVTSCSALDILERSQLIKTHIHIVELDVDAQLELLLLHEGHVDVILRQTES